MKKIRNIFTLLYFILYVLWLAILFSASVASILKPYRIYILIIWIIVFIIAASLITIENKNDKKAEDQLKALNGPPQTEEAKLVAKQSKIVRLCGTFIGVATLLGFLSIVILMIMVLGRLPIILAWGNFLMSMVTISWVLLLVAVITAVVVIKVFNNANTKKGIKVSPEGAAIPSNNANPSMYQTPMQTPVASTTPQEDAIKVQSKVGILGLPIPPVFLLLADRRVAWLSGGILFFYFDYTSKDPQDVNLCAKYNPIKVRYESIESWRVEPSTIPNEEASVCFYYKDAGNLMKLEFSLGAEVTLSRLIPDKEYSVVQATAAKRAQEIVTPTPVVPIQTMTQPIVQPAPTPVAPAPVQPAPGRTAAQEASTSARMQAHMEQTRAMFSGGKTPMLNTPPQPASQAPMLNTPPQPAPQAPTPQPQVQPAPAPVLAAPKDDIETRLLKLASLLAKKLITQEEYDKKRTELLDKF